MNDASRLTLQHLHYLVVLVAECHVTRAADKLGISQPAMSTALARLRKLFNDPILVRTTMGMQPTPRALDLAEKAKTAAELLGGGAGEQPFDPARADDHIRIMASDGVAEMVVPKLLAMTRALAPKLRFTIRSGDIRRSAEFLRDGELEFVMGFTRNKPDDLYQMLLYPQRIVCLVNRRHPKIEDSLTLDQFLAQDHVVWGAEPVPSPDLEALVDEALAAKGLSRRVIARVPSLSASAALVACTDLVAVVPHRMAQRAEIAETCHALPLPFATDPLDVQLMWHARWHRNTTHIWLRQIIRKIAKDLQARFASS